MPEHQESVLPANPKNELPIHCKVTALDFNKIKATEGDAMIAKSISYCHWGNRLGGWVRCIGLRRPNLKRTMSIKVLSEQFTRVKVIDLAPFLWASFLEETNGISKQY